MNDIADVTITTHSIYENDPWYSPVKWITERAETIELRTYTTGGIVGKPFVLHAGNSIRHFKHEASARKAFAKAVEAERWWIAEHGPAPINDSEAAFLNALLAAKDMPRRELVGAFYDAVAASGHEARIAAVRMGWFVDCTITPKGIAAATPNGGRAF